MSNIPSIGWYIFLSETRLINRPYNLIQNEAASHREIDHRQAENKWRSQESEDKIAEFPTKSEWKKYKNTLNISLYGFYLRFEEYGH